MLEMKNYESFCENIREVNAALKNSGRRTSYSFLGYEKDSTGKSKRVYQEYFDGYPLRKCCFVFGSTRNYVGIDDEI